MKVRRETRALIVHHSATPQTVTMEDIRVWHRARGWSDIGYHYVIEGNGALRVGRSFWAMGAHAGGFNRETLGLCIVGDNTNAARRWIGTQLETAREVVKALEMLFPAIHVYGHNEVGTTKTACPGMSGDDLREILKVKRRHT